MHGQRQTRYLATARRVGTKKAFLDARLSRLRSSHSKNLDRLCHRVLFVRASALGCPRIAHSIGREFTLGWIRDAVLKMLRPNLSRQASQ